MVGMIGACALRHQSGALLMRMFVRRVGGKRSDVKRCRESCKAMGTRAPDRRNVRPEHDHHQDQPSHAQRCPLKAQGAGEVLGHGASLKLCRSLVIRLAKIGGLHHCFNTQEARSAHLKLFLQVAQHQHIKLSEHGLALNT